MTSIKDYLPPPEECIALSAEELANHVLRFLNMRDPPTAFFADGLIENWVKEYPSHENEMRLSLFEAFQWLENEGLIGNASSSIPPLKRVTRAGSEFAGPDGQARTERSRLLASQLIHPVILNKVKDDFLKGDFDAAVGKAFNELEYRVRELTSISASVVGVSLMRQAFATSSGPLANASDLPAEQESVAHFIAGAIGWFKNPHSHRRVGRTEAVESAQLIVVASYLLGLVEARASANQPASNPSTVPSNPTSP
jgi:uncharacterized protein (TIGR02391 family)